MSRKISIVVAAHNEGENLWRTLNSCIDSCSTLECEIILADDASTDGSVDEAVRRFPQVRVVQHAERLGPSSTKHLGATAATGDVLVFLDGHCKPEPGAIARLVEDVLLLEGQAIVTPTVPKLNAETWTNAPGGGHGYRVWLDTLECEWLPLHQLRRFRRELIGEDRTFYESPNVIGCAFAISRSLYHELGGFDTSMRYWGIEDVDLGLTCWLMGYKIVHDPDARVGHRFQKKIGGYHVPPAHVLANQLYFARKHFNDSTWAEWLAYFRSRIAPASNQRRRNLWEVGWQIFEARDDAINAYRESRATRHVHDVLWYAALFQLGWPASGAHISTVAATDPDGTSGSPPPSRIDWGSDPDVLNAKNKIQGTTAGAQLLSDIETLADEKGLTVKFQTGSLTVTVGPDGNGVVTVQVNKDEMGTWWIRVGDGDSNVVQGQPLDVGLVHELGHVRQKLTYPTADEQRAFNERLPEGMDPNSAMADAWRARWGDARIPGDGGWAEYDAVQEENKYRQELGQSARTGYKLTEGQQDYIESQSGSPSP